MSREQIFYGKRLKAIRERVGLTQKNIASLLGVRENCYNQYESEYVIIPIKHLNTICNYFNVSLDYIFEFTKERNYPNINKEIDLKIIGQKLKEFRKENNLTQEKVAKFLNIDQPTWSIYEKGKSLIGTPFLYAICSKYNISADYLLGKIDTNTLKKMYK